MIKLVKGDIFTSTCQTLVNPVNCVGVMGAGLAKKFKQKYSILFEEYKNICDVGVMSIGNPTLHYNQNIWILNFPTKYHWKDDSKLEYITEGLDCFLRHYKEWGITSIAFPLLGAGLGGLDPSEVQDIMITYLSKCDIPIEIYEL